jgi:hypothetical protein
VIPYRWQKFTKTSEEVPASIFREVDGDSRFLCSVSKFLPDYMKSYERQQTSNLSTFHMIFIASNCKNY